MLEIIKYLLLGLIQGLTEPLPISSSGHMIIFEEIFSFATDLNFKIITNFGSLIAICIFYRKFLKELIIDSWSYLIKKDTTKKNSFIYILLVALATIPTGIAGYFLSDIVDEKLSNIFTVAICLSITGILLLIIDYLSKKAIRNQITTVDSILIGLSQIVGLIPGISRSGSTTSIGVFRKIRLEDSLRFSFMLYIPISIGSLILSLTKINYQTTNIVGYIGAFILSILGTLASIKLLFGIVKKENLKYFGYYCLLVSISIFIYLLLK